MTTQTNPQVTVQTRSNSPGCLVSGLWFIFFGWWIGGLATLTAWLLGVTIIGLPLSLFILNNLPFLLVLQPPSSETVTVSTPTGTEVKQRDMQQTNWFLRALVLCIHRLVVEPGLDDPIVCRLSDDHRTSAWAADVPPGPGYGHLETILKIALNSNRDAP